MQTEKTSDTRKQYTRKEYGFTEEQLKHLMDYAIKMANKR